MGTYLLLLPAILTATCLGLGAATPAGSPIHANPGKQRVPWTTSRVVGSPEPPARCQVRRVLPQLKFKDPVDLCRAPESNRLFLAEQSGKVYSFDNLETVLSADLAIDLAKARPGLTALYGITFHPAFKTNHFVYLCYVLKDGAPDGSRVSRFTMTSSDPPRIDPASEQVLITWLAGGHNGGSLQFGPDGFLYISTGDGAGPNPPDPLRTGQDNRDLLSCILRIDVNSGTPGQPYRVPPDNPFIAEPGARPEIWAYGLRNPWRMSFDQQSGSLWVADVGWELWELVYRVERGGNYGWSIMEGSQPVHSNEKRGPTPIVPPVKAHPHSEAASITGGYVYHGKRLPDLEGAYIYGDWVTGKIWALREQPNAAAAVAELVDSSLQIVCFAPEPGGELLVVDYGGGIYRLEPNSAPRHGTAFPTTLSATGLFDSVRDHVPAPGVLPFYVNASMWQDGGEAERFVAFPGEGSVETGATNVWVYQSKNEWRYPTNSVLARTVSLEMNAGDPASKRRLETQLLHFDGLDWHAYTYRWNEAQTDATLVSPEGEYATFRVSDEHAPGGQREQVWRFHSRAECLRCHNPWVNVALAFTAPQLNRTVPASPATAESSGSSLDRIAETNQLRLLSSLGYFDQNLNEQAKPTLTNPYDSTAAIHGRARSWLHVNCAHCHREAAGGSVPTQFDIERTLRGMKAVGQRPSQGTLGLEGAHVITAGDPASSVLVYRVASTGQGRMPLIGSTQVDPRGLSLLQAWIAQLQHASQAEEPEQIRRRERERQDLLSVRQSSDPDASLSALHRLLDSPNGTLALLSILEQRTGNTPLPSGFEEAVANHPAPHVHDLLERFLPSTKRRHTLGLNVQPEKILSLEGNAGRGRSLFFSEAAQCSRCHQVQAEGREFGPDLTRIAAKYTRTQLLDQILYPSRQIEPAFVSYYIETRDEAAHTGFVISKENQEVLLKDVDLHQIRIPASKVANMQPLQLSAMPEGLLQSLTAQEAADLLAFLTSLE